mmetsp:Transcript_21738/g.49468  ORF Transcript_21738/g.49468 Transcript_21738/m.49468 type:complete len:449 (+) Transcript_21738:66-1412(+)
MTPWASNVMASSSTQPTFVGYPSSGAYGCTQQVSYCNAQLPACYGWQPVWATGVYGAQYATYAPMPAAHAPFYSSVVTAQVPQQPIVAQACEPLANEPQRIAVAIAEHVVQPSADSADVEDAEKCMTARWSVASSSCSTAPSMRRPPKRRAPQGSRKALAAKHKQVENMVAVLLEDQANIAAHLEAGGDACAQALERLEGAVWRLSTDPSGCRLMQLAVAKATGAARSKLIEELRGHVREAMGSPHANHVLQKVVEVMPIEMASFIAHELAGIATDACRHRYGCRILCRLTEQFASARCVAKLLEDAMKNIRDLISHSFGKYVVAAILEHGSDKHKHVIANELRKDLMTIAINRHGSSSVERALMHCSEEDVECLVGQLLQCDVLELAQSQFGIYVVRGLAQMTGPTQDTVWQILQSAPPDVRETTHFLKLLQLLDEDADEADDEELQ